MNTGVAVALVIFVLIVLAGVWFVFLVAREVRQRNEDNASLLREVGRRRCPDCDGWGWNSDSSGTELDRMLSAPTCRTCHGKGSVR